MGNIVESARVEMASGVVAYTEFVLDFKKNSDAIYCFYEGFEDRSYYPFRITFTYPEDKYFDYICNGKENVIKVFDLINRHSSYSNSTLGFFIDRDFDPALDEKYSYVYTTPCYSIENLYVSTSAFRNILLNEFHISHNEDIIHKILDLFNICKEKYLNHLLILNSWLSCQAEFRIKNGITTRLNIDKTIKSLLDNVVGPDLQSIDFPHELETHENIELLFNKSPKVPQDVLERKINDFNKIDKSTYFRGKLQLKFLASFLKQLQQEISKKEKSMFEKKFSCNLRIEGPTLISQLSNNADTPGCLIRYIKQLKKE